MNTTKESYIKPEAEHIKFSFKTQVVAESGETVFYSEQCSHPIATRQNRNQCKYDAPNYW